MTVHRGAPWRTVIWAAALLNWLVIVIEAMFGAPLWAMVHLDMDGDGLWRRGRPG